MKDEDIPKQKRPLDDSIVELSSLKVINYMYYFFKYFNEAYWGFYVLYLP